MNPAQNGVLSGLVRIAAAVLLVGVLAFLYVKSESGELRRQPQIATYLRQLREIDVGWSRELSAARGEVLSTEAALRPVGQPLQALLDGLQGETVPLDDPALEAGLAGLRQSFLEKQGLVEQFAQQRDALRAELRGILAQIADIRQAAVAEQTPVLRAGLAGLDGQLTSLEAELLRHHAQPGAALRDSIRAAAGALPALALGLPEPLRTPLSGFPERVERVLQQEAALEQALQQIDLLPTAPRITSMTSAYDRAFQSMVDEKERYRVYLAFYSAALLVFLGYVLWQLGRSYVQLNQANEALRASNENLEHRVADRTKELSEALAHLKESELLLVQSEKMSSLGQMVAGIAHEINTPLAYVKSTLATLKERLPGVQRLVQEYAKLIQMIERGDTPDDVLGVQFQRVSELAAELQDDTGAHALQTASSEALHGIEQISEIILNLKNFSRLDRSKVSRFNLNEGLESTLVIARNLVKHKTVKRNLGEIPLIECSPSQVNQVFLNLITNAAQATTDDQSGEISVSSSVAPNGFVRVEISDNGHGIPDNVMPKIFDPFFTTKDIGKGTGLGLSVAYKIVQEHGGRIEVKSKVGRGTTFSVLLPVKGAQAQALAA